MMHFNGTQKYFYFIVKSRFTVKKDCLNNKITNCKILKIENRIQKYFMVVKKWFILCQRLSFTKMKSM